MRCVTFFLSSLFFLGGGGRRNPHSLSVAGCVYMRTYFYRFCSYCFFFFLFGYLIIISFTHFYVFLFSFLFFVSQLRCTSFLVATFFLLCVFLLSNLNPQK